MSILMGTYMLLDDSTCDRRHVEIGGTRLQITGVSTDGAFKAQYSYRKNRACRQAKLRTIQLEGYATSGLAAGELSSW